MSDDPSISKSSGSVEDSELASLNEKATIGTSQLIGYACISIGLILAALYISKYSGGFDPNNYLESDALSEEIDALRVSFGGQAGGDPDAPVQLDPLKNGEKIFQTNCMACHQVTGLGLPGSFPPLAGSDWVGKDPALLSKIVIAGMQGPITVNGTEYNSIMAPLGAVLDDEQIAHVLTYIRQAWSNDYPAVDTAVVTEARAATGARGMWTVEELMGSMGQ